MQESTVMAGQMPTGQGAIALPSGFNNGPVLMRPDAHVRQIAD
jgi:hypothetical protein